MNCPVSDSVGRRVLWGMLVAVLFGTTTWGQEPPADPRTSGTAAENPILKAGQRLRVTAASPGFTGRAVGNLVKIGSDTITLVDVERGSVMEMPLGSISRIEVGSLHRQTKKGVLIGLAVGAVMTAAIFASEEAVCGPSGHETCSTGDNAALSAFSVAFSVGVGAWWGYSKKSDAWVEAPIPHARVGVRPERGGGSARLAFRF